mmetsp:Transcript_32281/g.50321  ORF Transcript_32281/g.50321 Transcript_32281/m.50321 type:complete len:117 (+) Transcript_32281:2414-2764(+)
MPHTVISGRQECLGWPQRNFPLMVSRHCKPCVLHPESGQDDSYSPNHSDHPSVDQSTGTISRASPKGSRKDSRSPMAPKQQSMLEEPDDGDPLDITEDILRPQPPATEAAAESPET